MKEQALCNMKPSPEHKFGCPDDWMYHDTRRALKAAWIEFLDILGEGNYKLLSEATYIRNGVELCRGQMMISPQGIANAEASNNQDQ